VWGNVRTSLIVASGSLVPAASGTRIDIPGDPLELSRKFNQRLAGVQIGALGRQLAAVTRALMEHLGVHKLASSYRLNAARAGAFRRKTGNENRENGAL
jgi:hypothetical protein